MYTVELTCDEMEIIQNALAEWMEHQAGLAQATGERPGDDMSAAQELWDKLHEYEEEHGEIDLHPMYTAQFVDARTLRRKLVEISGGRDLTEHGC